MTERKSAATGARHYAPVQSRRATHREETHGGKLVAVVIVSIVVVLGLVYGAGVVAFNFLFMPNTTLDGQNVSWKLASTVSSSYAAKVGTYQTQVSVGGLNFAVRASDIGLTFDEARYEKGTIGQQSSWEWPLRIIGSHELTAQSGATFDADKLRTLIEDQVNTYNETAQQPTNATFAFNKDTQSYAVVPEKAGTALEVDPVVSAVSAAMEGLPARITVDESTALVQPSVRQDDANLALAVDNANRFLTADIPLTLGGQPAGQVTREQISGWIVLGEDLNATLDQDKLADWVAKNIGYKFDTVNTTRTYTRPDGKQVTVANSGKNNYGWITDEAKLCSDLTAAIESGSTASLEIPTKQKAQSVPDAGGKDWGNRFIDVDVTEQHVRMYDDSGALVWESDCVTGNSSKGYDTPQGVYRLNDYRANGNVELRGKIDPATNEPEYISHVEYWMPFIGNSWAFHDADWRSSFGGAIYQTNGSHGCINLPPAKAAELFNLCKVGDVVIVHA